MTPRYLRVIPVLTATLLPFSNGCRKEILSDACSEDRVALYHAMLDTVLTDTNVIKSYGKGHPIKDYYVYPRDRSITGIGIWRYELFRMVYGVEYIYGDSLHTARLKALLSSEGARSDLDAHTADQCLEAFGGDSTAYTLIYGHRYNDSLFMMEVRLNSNYFHKVEEPVGGRHYMTTPLLQMQFLFVHDGRRIQKVYRSGPWYD